MIVMKYKIYKKDQYGIKEIDGPDWVVQGCCKKICHELIMKQP